MQRLDPAVVHPVLHEAGLEGQHRGADAALEGRADAGRDGVRGRDPVHAEATIKPRIKVTAATAMPDLLAPQPEHVIAVGKAPTGTKISLLGGGGMWEHLGQAIADQTALKPGGRDNAAAKGTEPWLTPAGAWASKEETFATAVEPFRQSEQLPPMELASSEGLELLRRVLGERRGRRGAGAPGP